LEPGKYAGKSFARHYERNPNAPHLSRLLRARRERPEAVAPPSSVMNSRRLMPDIGVPPASALPVYRALNLLKKGRKVLGPDLNRSESAGALPSLPRLARWRATAALRDLTELMSALGHVWTAPD